MPFPMTSRTVAAALSLLAALPARATPEGNLAAARIGPGRVVWESNRGGAFRIWLRELDGSPAQQVSPEEPGRDHCCAHLSPDGERLVYLALPAGAQRYTEPHLGGELRLVDLARSRERVLAPRARHYGEHRAALWWSEDELVYLDGAGATRLHDLSRGSERVLTRGPERGEGFLVDPTGRYATSSTATFSERDPATGEVLLSTALGGCQAVFVDGTLGLWTAGAGGPIDAIDLRTRATVTILRKHDPRLPADRGYLYFPMMTRDRSLLAWGASADQHDHFRSDYDVFLAELDPESLQLLGKPVQITAHPAVVRNPDVGRLRRGPPPRAAPLTAPPRDSTAGGLPAAGWPAAHAQLAFAWQAADRANRRASAAASEVLAEHGEVAADRLGRLALAGGYAAATAERAREVAAELRGANAVTVELVLEAESAPAASAAERPHPILALGSGPARRGILLELASNTVTLRLRTGPRGADGGAPITLLELPDPRPHHVAFTYSPGRLNVFLDGAHHSRHFAAGDFFPWRVNEFSLTFGSEGGREERFVGFLSHLAIFAREAPSAEIEERARQALGELARPAPATIEASARLLRRARVPALEEISPYRRALVLEEWALVQQHSGGRAPDRLWVVRYALLDGQPTRAALRAPGALARLRLEPYADQPQLRSVVLARAGLEPGGERLWFDTALVPER